MTGDRRIVVATLGDSIIAGNPGWDPDPSLREREGDDETSQFQYWAALRDSRLDFRNHGVGGEVTEEIMARFDEAVVGADALVVQGGINDVYHGLETGPAARNLRELVQRGLKLGLAVAIADVLPWNRGWPGSEPKIRTLNASIASIAAEAEIELLHFHDTLEDPDAPGRMRPDWTADGNHPSVAGYRRLGELAFRLPALPGSPDLPSPSQETR